MWKQRFVFGIKLLVFLQNTLSVLYVQKCAICVIFHPTMQCSQLDFLCLLKNLELITTVISSPHTYFIFIDKLDYFFLY